VTGRRRGGLSRRAVVLAGLAAVVALLGLAGCGDDHAGRPAATAETTSATSAASTGTPATPDAPEASPVLPVTFEGSAGSSVTISSVDRIVPVDGDLAEIVFALGLGDQVVATDLSATYPPEAAALPDIGYQRALDPEPIAAVDPTVVLATDLAGPVETLDQLRSLGITVVVIERSPTLDGPAQKVQAVADALGVPNRGRVVVEELEADMRAALERAAAVDGRPRVLALYLRGDRVQLIFGKGTGVDVLLPAVGATDVAAELGIVDTQQITAEAMLRAAPDVLLVTTSGLESVGGVEGLLRIPGIARTPAGEDRRVLAYEDQYLLGGGPRTGQLMADLVRDLHPPQDTEGAHL
jgi:iron complex transport system substrate-binding protein